MRVALVDDEFYALQGLRIKLSEIEDVDIVGMYEDSTNFLQDVAMLNLDVVILDIEMPKLDGFEVLARLRELQISASVIFITAYSDYRARIAKTDAIDYIVKPVTRERLIEALEKVKKK